MGERGEPRSEQDMMNPGTDNLLLPHAQPTHTHKHTHTDLHSHKKNKSQSLTARLRNCIFSVPSPLRCHCICRSFRLWSACKSIKLRSQRAATPIQQPAMSKNSMAGWLWQIKPAQYMAITFAGWHEAREAGRRSRGKKGGEGRWSQIDDGTYWARHGISNPGTEWEGTQRPPL